MSMLLMEDNWKSFGIGGRESPHCQPLDIVGHVTHVETALEILADGYIKSSAVSDGITMLDRMKVSVVFASPYDWEAHGDGYRFGNVAFKFPWAGVVNKKHYYWIGAKQHFRLMRPRILVTPRIYKNLRPYTPETGDGPWWLDKKGNQHYWHGRYCVEFLLEHPMLMVGSLQEMTFVRGHPTQCSNRNRCFEPGHDREKAALRMLAGMCFFGTIGNAARLLRADANTPTEALAFAWNQVETLIPKGQQWRGSVRPGSSQAVALSRAIMGARYRQIDEDQSALLGMFADRKSAIESLAALIENELELEKGALPRS